MVLFSQRLRRGERDAREAAGERLWTEDIPRAARVKIAAVWDRLQDYSRNALSLGAEIGWVLKSEGGHEISSVDSDGLVRVDDPVLALDVIGALVTVTRRKPILGSLGASLESSINTVFEDHRVAYRVVDGETIPLESDELHSEVVVPALRLMVEGRFAKAHEAYLSAIKEIPHDPSDAITDAGTALQEMLTALGCDGNALGPLITSAKKKGLLAAHDSTLSAGIEKFLSWASADRSQSGDGHKVSDAERSDAWLMVHIVGALIVRLADQKPRT